MHRLARSIWLPRPRPKIFAFFADVTNLERITPPELHFRIAGNAPTECRAGTSLEYHLTLFGAPLRWRTLITVWRPGERFVDEQIAGPYRMWVHTHRFRDERGGTRMDDEVRYRLPLAPLGELAWPLIGLQLCRIFDYRRRVIRELFGGAPNMETGAPAG